MSTFQTPLDAFQHWLNKDPDFIFLRQPINRKFIEYSRQDAYNQAIAIAASLHGMGLKPGDHVALLSKNCAHWFMADLAIMLGGFVSVPLYPTLDKDSINEILVHSESKAVIIGKLDDYSKQKAGIPKDIQRIGVELYGVEEQRSWETLIKEDHSSFDPPGLNPDELITIMYTSGTTGNPKGVMHKVSSFNLMGNITQPTLHVPDNCTYFSYLPLSHIAERIGIEIVSFYCGGCVSFPESLDTFAEDLANVKPVFFVAVPRIWQKFQEKILEKFTQKKLDTLISLPLLGRIVKKKIRQKLGLNNAKLCYTGAAPIAVSLLEWYDKLGINILQGYGMTEDCILSHFNIIGSNRFGSVGKPMPGTTARLSPEGEIQVKSDALMVGYYKEQAKTDEVFTEDGFIKTGDIGEYDHDGYLSITGRIKDQFKTDKGKYVTPSQIELKLSKNTDIEQICVVGMGIAQPIALIVPSETGEAKEKQAFEESILQTIDAVNPTLMSHEKLSKAVIMKEQWTVDNGLMTPSLKVRRPRVEAIHQDMYKSWFDREERLIYE
ncbi:AMP-binding protein [Ekhidna sp. To15]|uniref:AMP-binding protein n=1 Tax=Ekhidna sp. To15 TaxID=3395267 RepID=UPI003F51FA74